MNIHVMKRYAPMLLIMMTLAGCMPSSNDMNVLRAQVTQHDQILQQLNMQLSGVQPAQADTWSQVQSIRQEIASLRGEMDTMSHAFKQAGGAQAMSDMLSRHERALRLIETQLAMNLQLDDPVDGTGLPGVGMPSTGMPSTGLPVGNVTEPTGVPVVPNTTPGVTAPIRPGTTDTAQVLYDTGMAAFNARRYEQALKAFGDFTTAYPDHALVSNSWFWKGESLYQLKNYGEAALAYEKVISGFPNSNKAPAAYLKQGLSFVQLGTKDAARERLDQLIQKYPKAPEATRARQEIQNYKL